MRERLSQYDDEPITDYLITKNIPLLNPETSLMEALYLIYQHHSHAIIIEKGSRRFLGVVSITAFSIIFRVLKDKLCKHTQFLA